jgi:hypothetical protein
MMGGARRRFLGDNDGDYYSEGAPMLIVRRNVKIRVFRDRIGAPTERGM